MTTTDDTTPAANIALPMKNRRRVVIILVTVVLLVSLTFYVYQNYFMFSQANWKNDINRWTMVSSIINRELLDRKSYYEAVDILGEPSFYRGTKTQTKDTTTLTLVYLTGGMQFIDLETLCVDIVNDSVSKVYLDYD